MWEYSICKCCFAKHSMPVQMPLEGLNAIHIKQNENENQGIFWVLAHFCKLMPVFCSCCHTSVCAFFRSHNCTQYWSQGSQNLAHAYSLICTQFISLFHILHMLLLTPERADADAGQPEHITNVAKYVEEKNHFIHSLHIGQLPSTPSRGPVSVSWARRPPSRKYWASCLSRLTSWTLPWSLSLQCIV